MNYPTGVKKTTTTYVNNKNRGLTLEKELNDTNKYYKAHKIAYIYKKPTPIKLVKVDYKKSMILEGYFEMPSTTDYNGIYNGYYIDFEAKETTSKTSFPLANIHNHQIEHIKNIKEEKGISFIIVRFTTLNLTFILFADKLLEFIEKENRKSIPLTYFNEFGYLIKDTYQPRIDYLKIIDKILKEM